MGMSGKNSPTYFLTAEQQGRIVEAIKAIESRTTGEIRVYIEPHCTYMDALDRAKELFYHLEMDETLQHNGVLIYMAHIDHQLAIYGDERVFTEAGGQSFWDAVVVKMLTHFRQGQLVEGIVEGINGIGDVLITKFPFDPNVQKNELPDEIVFG